MNHAINSIINSLSGDIMDQNELEQKILDFIHKETGWAYSLQPYSEFEDLSFMEIKTQKDGTILVSFKYFFDEDGFSHYDKSHHLVGQVIFSNMKEIISSKLEEIYTGEGSNLNPYKGKKSE